MSDTRETEGPTALGKKVIEYAGLDSFACPEYCSRVTMVSDEVTAVCPVTSQPDWYTVTIYYEPSDRCVESKTLKLYLHSFRDKGLFCEALASAVLKTVCAAVRPNLCRVTVVQKARGGVAITSVSETPVEGTL